MTRIEHIRPIEIFCCYAQANEKLKQALIAHLSGIRRLGLIGNVYSREISAETAQTAEICQHLNNAAIALLLISPKFVNSAYCSGDEMRLLLQKHEEGKLRAIPVLLYQSRWKRTLPGKLAALPANEMPVKRWSDQDEAFAEIARSIHEIIDGFLALPEPARIGPPAALPGIGASTQPAAALSVASSRQSDEEELLALLLQNGDLAASFELILNYYGNSLQRFSRRYVGNDSVATTMVVQAMVHVYAELYGALQTEQGRLWLQTLELEPYLFDVARSECDHYLKQEGYKQDISSPADFSRRRRQIEMDMKHSQRLHGLPFAHQQAVHFSREEDLPGEEITSRAKMPESVRQRYERHAHNVLHRR